MKKSLLLIALFASTQIYGQISGTDFGGIKVPQYMGSLSSGNNRLPVIYRAHIGGLIPGKAYKYISQGIVSSDFNSTSLTPGAGDPIYIDSTTFKTNTGASFTTANGHDSFYASFAGEYDGYFGFYYNSDSRFTAGKAVYPYITIIGINTTDTYRRYCIDSITVIAWGTSASTGTGIWGKSLAKAKNIVALFDNESGFGRPITLTMVEKDGITVSSAPSFYSTNVDNTNGSWGTIIPNNLSGGIRRIENLNRLNGFEDYSNTDADGIWGPSNKSTINTSGGASTPVALDENDAALISPTVEFWTRTSTIKENIGVKEVYVIRKYSNSTPQSVRLTLISGNSATKGSGGDFDLSEPKTITFKAGAQATDTTKITVYDDNLAEADEVLVLRLDQPSNCIIGAEPAHTMTIVDNDTALISVRNKFVYAKEDAGYISVVIKTNKAMATQSKMRLYVKKTGDTSYIPAEFKLGTSGTDSVFDIGNTTKADSFVVSAKIIDDLKGDPHDTFVCILRQISGIGRVSDSVVTMVVFDNDGPAIIRFASEPFSVSETAGTFKIKIKVDYKTDAGGDFTVRYLTSGSTASEGSDLVFNPTSKIISINASTPDTIVVTVPLIDDDVWEQTETAMFSLGYLSNVIIKNQDSVTVKILNNDRPQYNISTITKQNKVGKVGDSIGVICRVVGTVYGSNQSTTGLLFNIIDGTGGISIMSAAKTFGYTVAEGDSVMVEGKVAQNQGLMQLQNLDTVRLISMNRKLKNPTLLNDVTENTENSFVKFTRVKLVSSSDWPTAALSPNTSKYVRVQHTDGTVDTMNIDAETNIDGTAAPTGYINVTGLSLQYDASSPLTGNYVIQPRRLTDIETAILPVVQFKKFTDTVTELADSFRMDFSVLPLDENFSFDVVVKSASASSPADYNFTKRTINVIKNNSVNPIKANISDDVAMDGHKNVVFAIRNVVGPGSIGADSVLLLVINDDETTISIQNFTAGNIQLYPNPSSGTVYIQSPVVLNTIEIFSVDGRKVWSSDKPNTNFEINMKNQSGIYLVKARAAGGTIYTSAIVLK